MREVKSSSGFAMNAYVILDEHFHWIITPRKQNFSTIMQSIKLRFVRRYKKAIKRKANEPYLTFSNARLNPVNDLSIVESGTA
jgi:putative transposase